MYICMYIRHILYIIYIYITRFRVETFLSIRFHKLKSRFATFHLLE